MTEITGDILRLAARCMRTHRHQFTYAGKMYVVQPRSHNTFTMRESHSGTIIRCAINRIGKPYIMTREEIQNGYMKMPHAWERR